MSDVMIWTGTRFACPPAGFDSDFRYLRQASGGGLLVSGGRTWRLGTWQASAGEPWVAWRFDVGVPGGAVDVVQISVSNTNYFGSCSAVGPTTTGSVTLA